MAVVTGFGDGYRQSASPAGSTTFPAVLAVKAQAHQKGIQSSVTITNGDSATSVYFVGHIPSSAIIDPAALAYGPGITGITSVSLGIGASPQPASPLGGFAAQPNLLVNAQNWTAAASFTLYGNVAVTNYGKRLWELLGLALDPGVELDLILTINTGATQTGVLQFFMKYFLDH